MKPPKGILYGETFAEMKQAIKILNKVDLSEREIGFIKGVITDASFLFVSACSDEMYGFMEKYSDLMNKWEERKV